MRPFVCYGEVVEPTSSSSVPVVNGVQLSAAVNRLTCRLIQCNQSEEQVQLHNAPSVLRTDVLSDGGGAPSFVYDVRETSFLSVAKKQEVEGVTSSS